MHAFEHKVLRCSDEFLFAAGIAADCVNGHPLENSVKKAAAFVRDCILATEKRDIPPTDGVCFEDVLYRLKV